MIDIEAITRSLGTVSLLLIFVIKFYIAVTTKSSINMEDPELVQRLLKIVDTLINLILWSSMFILFLFFLGLLRWVGLINQGQGSIVYAVAALITLVAVIVSIYLGRKIEKKEGLI